MSQIYLSIGSNKGNRYSYIKESLDMIRKDVGDIELISKIYETKAWGFESDDFLNLCILVRSKLSPDELLVNLKYIENKIGRKFYSHKIKAREIDIDILFYSTKIINKKGHIYSKTLSNWKYIVSEDLFKVCYPKTFKNSNKFGVSTLLIMVKRGHEVDMEYSKKDIMDKMNSFFGYTVVEKLKFISFENERKFFLNQKNNDKIVTNSKFQNKIKDVRNEKIKKSLIELTKVFKAK